MGKYSDVEEKYIIKPMRKVIEELENSEKRKWFRKRTNTPPLTIKEKEAMIDGMVRKMKGKTPLTKKEKEEEEMARNLKKRVDYEWEGEQKRRENKYIEEEYLIKPMREAIEELENSEKTRWFNKMTNIKPLTSEEKEAIIDNVVRKLKRAPKTKEEISAALAIEEMEYEEVIEDLKKFVCEEWEMAQKKRVE
ncbi:MAG: hypothetical protein GX882_10340, partial [Methanomicrobiales archaeon]|nr:hypothetical protein [Methanomicrobiales archaeon]